MLIINASIRPPVRQSGCPRINRIQQPTTPLHHLPVDYRIVLLLLLLHKKMTSDALCVAMIDACRHCCSSAEDRWIPSSPRYNNTHMLVACVFRLHFFYDHVHPVSAQSVVQLCIIVDVSEHNRSRFAYNELETLKLVL